MAIIPTGRESEFDYGVKNNASQTDDAADFVVIQDANGVQGKTTDVYKNIKAIDKNVFQTGIFRPDLDTSVLTISPVNTLTITNVNNLLFVNQILPDTPANKITDFLKSFASAVFVADSTNTPVTNNTRSVYYVGVDRSGASMYRTSKVYDLDICYLARIIVANTAGVYTIISFKYFPDLAANEPSQKDRTILASGMLVPSGASSISFGNRAVSFTKNSINYSNNKFDPNFLNIPDSVNPTPMQFIFATPNISNVATSIVPITVLDPKTWYLASGAVGGNNVTNTSYQVYQLALTVAGQFVIQTIASTVNTPVFGVNAIFANREDALAGLSSVVFPPILPLNDLKPLGTFYLRAGTNVNGSGLLNSDDFFFNAFSASTSISSTGSTVHDTLTGKNSNPLFLHVDQADISNWNNKQDALINPVTSQAGGALDTGAGYIPRLVNNTLIDDSNIYQDASGNVGINVNNPLSKLHSSSLLNSDSYLIENSGAFLAGVDYGIAFGQHFEFDFIPWIQSMSDTSVPKAVSVNPNGGNVLIGTPIDNKQSTLQVAGNVSLNELRTYQKGVPNGIVVTSNGNEFVSLAQGDETLSSQGNLLNINFLRTLRKTGSGTIIRIPFLNQSILNSTTYVTLRAFSGDFNIPISEAIKAEFGVGHFTTIINLVEVFKSAGIVSITINGMNIDVLIANALTDIYVEIDYMTNQELYSIIRSGVAFI
jgi:hypothetical protein